MAAVLTNKVELYNTAEFDLDTPADLSKLPTQTTGGTGELSYVGPIRQGSFAVIGSTGEVYRLDGDSNTWKKF